MPLVRIEILKGKSSEYKKGILDGIHAALGEALKIPDYDRTQRLYELDKSNFEIHRQRSENYTIIEITMFKGRSLEAKRKLYSEIVKNLEVSPGIDGIDILIVVHEPKLENWGIRGGKLPNEVGLEFKIIV